MVSASSDLTPARSLASQTSRVAPCAATAKDLPTLGAILKAEPLRPPPAQQTRNLGDLLREPQDDDLSRADSLHLTEEANRCCVPQFARAISCDGRRRRRRYR